MKPIKHANWCSCTQHAYFRMHAQLLSQARGPKYLSWVTFTIEVNL